MHLRICRSCRDQSSWEFFGFWLYDDGRRIRFDFTVSLCNIHDIDQLLFKKSITSYIKWNSVFFGGIVLFLIGNAMGGHLDYVTVGGITVVLYLALVSAVAYTLWSVLLAYNDVSKVAIFGFVNPLCSVILSALVLGEVKQAFNIGSLIALALVYVGIYIVNAKNNNKSNVE